MPRLVFRGYETEARGQGDTVNVPIPPTTSTADVTPSNVLPAPVATTPTTVPLVIDQWKKNVPFGITDKEMTEINENANYIPDKTASAIEALARGINANIFSNYTKVYGAVGTAGTTPFSGDKAGDVSQAKRLLAEQLCPTAGRNLVIDPSAEANAAINAQLSDMDKVNREVHIEGEIGRRHGFDFFMDQDVPYHTAGTSAGTLAAAAGSVGDTTLACDTGTGTLVVGDIITFAGHDQQYVIDTAVADVSSGTLSFNPALVAAVADNAAVTVLASHRVNLAFHPNAFAFVSVPMENRENMVQIVDDVTGIVLRLEQIQEYKQKAWEFDVLYGSACIRPELAVRVLG